MTDFKYKQIAHALARQISDGSFRPGERLPSLREFSSRRGVSLNTVLAAYTELERRGQVEARKNSGFFVRSQRVRKDQSAPTPTVHSRRVVISDLSHAVLLAASDSPSIPLGFVSPHPELLPLKALTSLVKQVASRRQELMTDYIYPPGYQELRVQLARRSIEEGIGAHPEDFLITSGTMEALELALRSTTSPGDTIAVESPSHFNLFPLFASLGLRALEVPSKESQGISLSLLFRSIKKHKVQAVLLTPNFNSPQGGLMPDENKLELVRKLRGLNIPIIEDNVYGEIYFGKNRPTSLLHFDDGRGVISCGSFSKTLGGGWRVGWIRGGIHQSNLQRLKFMSTIGTSSLPQAVLAEFLRQGFYDRHLRGLRRELQTHAKALRELVRKRFGSEVQIALPMGGYSLWCEFEGNLDSEIIFHKARESGIAITPGALFATQKQRYNHCLRLGFGSPITRETMQGVERLAQIIEGAGI